MVMGLEEDPEDHAAVATSIFITGKHPLDAMLCELS